MTEIIFQNGVHQITVNGASYAKILPCEGATDTFEPIEGGARRWHRHTDAPVDHMRT